MKKEIDIQKENVKKLLELAQENPDLRIMPMVETECVPSDDWSWWVASFGKAEIDEVYAMDERMYIRSSDEEDLVDMAVINSDWPKHFSDNEINEMAEAVVASYEWEKVILVRITN